MSQAARSHRSAAQGASRSPYRAVLASDATPRCASMASADRQMIGDATRGSSPLLRPERRVGRPAQAGQRPSFGLRADLFGRERNARRNAVRPRALRQLLRRLLRQLLRYSLRHHRHGRTRQSALSRISFDTVESASPHLAAIFAYEPSAISWSIAPASSVDSASSLRPIARPTYWKAKGLPTNA